MTQPWRTRPPYNSSGPCTHALIIGTSYYRNLPQNAADPVPDNGRVTLSLGQATTPASSALAFARWLENDYRSPQAPLGSIRLLVSASEEEKRQHDALAHPEDTVLPATRPNVKAAIREWKRDCEKNREHVAVFYAAGHGIQLSKDDSIVLLEDFADPDENVLEGAMDIGSIWRGMSNKRAAGIQFYFVDACRIKPEVFRRYEEAPVGVTLDVEEDGSADAAPIFFSAAPRSFALGEPGKGTLFCQALLDCLRLHGVEGPDEENRWVVSTSSLLKRLRPRVAELAQEHRERQDAVPGGLPVDVIFHVLPKPPRVPLSISLQPGNASRFASARLSDGITEKVIFENAEFTPALNRVVPGGRHILAVQFPPDVVQFRSRNAVVAALPPRCVMEVLV